MTVNLPPLPPDLPPPPPSDDRQTGADGIRYLERGARQDVEDAVQSERLLEQNLERARQRRADAIAFHLELCAMADALGVDLDPPR